MGAGLRGLPGAGAWAGLSCSPLPGSGPFHEGQEAASPPSSASPCPAWLSPRVPAGLVHRNTQEVDLPLTVPMTPQPRSTRTPAPASPPGEVPDSPTFH